MGTRRAVLQRDPAGSRAAPPQPASGQTLVVMALSMLVLLGALGLAIDGGYQYIMRRAMQNAADAAAMAGAVAISRNLTDAQVTAAVQDAATRNGVVTVATNVTCTYITNSYPGGITQACGNSGTAVGSLIAYPNQVTGVLVRVSEQHATFVMRALGIPQAGTAATAASQVQAPAGLMVGPFVVCGIDTVTTDAQPNFSGSIYAKDGYWPYTINNQNKVVRDPINGQIYDNCEDGPCGKTLEGSAGPVINADAYYYGNGPTDTLKYGGSNHTGPEFLIHDPSGSSGINPCNDSSQSFKGVNTSPTTITLTYGSWSPVDTTLPAITTGNVSSVNSTVEGINGCKAGGALDNCVMILPIVDNSGPGGSGSNAKLAVRTFGTFYIRQIANGSHTGRLIKTYNIRGASSATYVTGSGAPSVIRMLQ